MDSAMVFFYSLQGVEAYALLLGIGCKLPVNKDILLLSAASLTLKGVMDPVLRVAVKWLGQVMADSLVVHCSHRFVRQLLHHRFLTRLMPETGGDTG